MFKYKLFRFLMWINILLAPLGGFTLLGAAVFWALSQAVLENEGTESRRLYADAEDITEAKTVRTDPFAELCIEEDIKKVG